jgi:hypothetical protein
MRQTTVSGVLSVAVIVSAIAGARAQAVPERFEGTATVKTSTGATASAPVTIVIDRKMPQNEAERFVAAFKTGGAAALRKALVGVAPTGSVKLGSGTPTAARLTIERRTDKGRLLTIVTDTPILFLGAGLPGAKPKEGYDFAVLDLEVDDAGNGIGQLSPAAKVTVNKDMFVVDDYSSELIRLTGVKKLK